MLLFLAAGSRADGEAMYLANAGLMITEGDTKVLFDPLFRNGFGQYQLLPVEMEEALFAGDAPVDGVDAHIAGGSLDPGRPELSDHRDVGGGGMDVDVGTDRRLDEYADRSSSSTVSRRLDRDRVTELSNVPVVCIWAVDGDRAAAGSGGADVDRAGSNVDRGGDAVADGELFSTGHDAITGRIHR